MDQVATGAKLVKNRVHCITYVLWTDRLKFCSDLGKQHTAIYSRAQRPLKGHPFLLLVLPNSIDLTSYPPPPPFSCAALPGPIIFITSMPNDGKYCIRYPAHP